MSDNTNVNTATSNAGAIAMGVWLWLKAHPVALGVLAFLLGLLIG